MQLTIIKMEKKRNTFKAHFMKKLSNTEAGLKKESITYKKGVYKENEIRLKKNY